MIIPVPIGEKRYCAIQGSVPTVVRCESCQTEYVYLATRVGRGEHDNLLWLSGEEASQKAHRAAERRMAQDLALAIDPVPCPQCGHFQSTMIWPARRQYLLQLNRGAWYVAAISACGLLLFVTWHRSFPTFLPATVIMVMSGCAFGAAVGFLVYRAFKANRFQPNSLPLDHRLNLGKALALNKSQYLKLQSLQASP